MDTKNYNTCKLIRNRIDLYLFEMARLFTNIGTESTEEEKASAYAKEAEYIELIAELDPEKGARLRAS